MFIGYSTRIQGSVNKVPVVGWVHQPFGRGPNARPVAEDSAIVTVQVVPQAASLVPPGVVVRSSFLGITWSAAQNGKMSAEMDLQRGVSFSVVATSVNVFATVEYDDSQNPGAASTVLVDLQATIGRGTRPSFLDHPVRTQIFGPVAPAAQSGVVPIPAFARSVAIETSSIPPGLSVRVLQLSNNVVVQADDVGSPLSPVTINSRADSVAIVNLGLAQQDFYAVFRIAL